MGIRRGEAYGRRNGRAALSTIAKQSGRSHLTVRSDDLKIFGVQTSGWTVTGAKAGKW